jgi:tetratricopeptide (TPR) repeat protein
MRSGDPMDPAALPRVHPTTGASRAEAPSPRVRLERICAKNPTSILFARLAEACLRDGDLNHAAALCRRGLRYRPSYAAGHLVMAACHLQAGSVDGARDEFQKVLQLDADNLAALIGLGKVEAALGRSEAARRCRERLRSLDPFHPLLSGPEFQADRPLSPPGPPEQAAVPGHSEASGDPEEGDDEVAQEGGRRPVHDLPFATVTLARLYASQGHLGLARATLERVLRDHPDHPEALSLLEAVNGGGRRA